MLVRGSLSPPGGLWVRSRGGAGASLRPEIASSWDVLAVSHVSRFDACGCAVCAGYSGAVTVNLPMRLGLTTLAPKRQMQRTAMLSAAK